MGDNQDGRPIIKVQTHLTIVHTIVKYSQVKHFPTSAQCVIIHKLRVHCRHTFVVHEFRQESCESLQIMVHEV